MAHDSTLRIFCTHCDPTASPPAPFVFATADVAVNYDTWNTKTTPLAGSYHRHDPGGRALGARAADFVPEAVQAGAAAERRRVRPLAAAAARGGGQLRGEGQHGEGERACAIASGCVTAI